MTRGRSGVADALLYAHPLRAIGQPFLILFFDGKCLSSPINMQPFDRSSREASTLQYPSDQRRLVWRRIFLERATLRLVAPVIEKNGFDC